MLLRLTCCWRHDDSGGCLACRVSEVWWCAGAPRTTSRPRKAAAQVGTLTNLTLATKINAQRSVSKPRGHPVVQVLSDRKCLLCPSTGHFATSSCLFLLND